MRGEWFRETFGIEYLSLYAHRDDKEAADTLALVQRHVPVMPGASVLDAPCGAGRHAAAFVRAGYDVTGLDLSRELLAHARRERPGPHYVRGDLRHLPFPAAWFDLILNLFSSFGYFETDAENACVLAEFVRVCRPRGSILFDYMNEPNVRATLERRSTREIRSGVHVLEERWIDATPPRVNKRTTVSPPGATPREYLESVRLYTPDEITRMMQAAGFEPASTWGNYQAQPHTPNSPRFILHARRL
jgi:SAM-dependent methyltransferase